MDLMDFINKFGAEDSNTEKGHAENVAVNDDSQNGTLSNEEVLDCLTAHFKAQLLKRSFKNVITFPMSFTVILNKYDFDEFKDYSGIVSKHAVLSFYEVIKNELTEGRICENLATYWNISFLPCEGEPLAVGNQSVYVKQGKCYICSTVHDQITDNVKNAGEGGSTFTISKGGSEVYGNVNINRATLDQLRLVGEAHFQMNWDPRLSSAHISEEKKADEKPETPAVAKLCVQGKEFKLYSGTYIVSGNKETRRDKNIFIVNNPFIKNGHIEIYEKDKKFKIAAFGPTKVNGTKLNVSTGNDKQYFDLLDNQSINMDDEVVMVFKILN